MGKMLRDVGLQLFQVGAVAIVRPQFKRLFNVPNHPPERLLIETGKRLPNNHCHGTANIEAGNNTQLMIRDLTESYGLTIGKARAPGVVCAVSTVAAIYTKYGYHTLSRTLRLIIGAWEGDPNFLSANMLNAVAKLVVVYGDALNDEVFKDKVGAVSLKQLIRVA